MFSASNSPFHLSSRQGSHGAHSSYTQTINATKLRVSSMSDDAAVGSSVGNTSGEGGDVAGEDDPRQKLFRERFARTEARLDVLFGGAENKFGAENADSQLGSGDGTATSLEHAPQTVTGHKPARVIDEDDYGDEEEGDEDDAGRDSPIQPRRSLQGIGGDRPPTFKPNALQANSAIFHRASVSSAEQSRSSDDVRKKLEEDKKAAEEAAKKSSYTLFYTLETDRDAMLEQQKLDELDRQVETEMSGHAGHGGNNTSAGSAQQGTLSSANLGASSLTLKHLIARIDAARDKVLATDAQLRNLMSEVRKNRSKWASEDKVGQEELYEAAEKVLMELKAMTEYAGPFLQRVNKRDAPDYYTIIKHPMDIGTMLKKLKTLQYKSKKEFVDDLNLIWSNCLRYNADPSHFLRKKALYMRKETEKLVPLIPDIVVRDRAEVEAEERRLQNGDADLEGGEDSDDEEPIMASRGRKAHGTKGKKGSMNNNAARKTAHSSLDGTPSAESKPTVPFINGVTSNLKSEFLRADSDAPLEGSTNGLSTPPAGTLTPLGPHGVPSSGAPGSQADLTEADGTSASGLASGHAEDPDIDDVEFKTWKHVTKKDRATVAAERNRLFRNNQINPDEPALLRTKAGMRRWLRHQEKALSIVNGRGLPVVSDGKVGSQNTAGETLAEGIEREEERLLPDYYDTLSAIPDIDERLRWVEDADGQVIEQSEEFLRMLPKGYFTSPDSNLSRKMEANMRQMQETRKICTKIGVVKQMQLQSQMYQNQFKKYDPQPFVDADPGPVVVSDNGPVMAPWVCRAALQRSVAKIFYHAGFEEYQPSALDAVTDIAADVFYNLARTLGVYRETPKVAVPLTSGSGTKTTYKSRFTSEEAILHCLDTVGQDVESLESYVNEDVDRLGSKLGVMHERMKSHLADLLRPALDSSAGADGAGAFVDGSEQFVGGDFATDIDEDFFGFKELGLDREFGMASLSVPLHLLQNRMHNAYQAQNATSISAAGVVMQQPPPLEPITIHNVKSQIGLVQDFFLAKLHANNDEPLLEDEDLPVKQRFPKPRLGPTGKITSPRKRPPKELQQMAKKKRKLEDGKEEINGLVNGTGPPNGTNKNMLKPVGKLRLEMPSSKEAVPEPEKDDGSAVGMISPESIAA